MTSTTKARSATSKTNGTGSTRVTSKERNEAAHGHHPVGHEPHGATAVDTTVVTDVPLEELERENREARRRIARQQEADERALRWNECVDAAREGLQLHQDLLKEAQKDYDRAAAEASRLDNVVRVDRDGFGPGFWRIIGFVKTTAGFDEMYDEAKEARLQRAEAELIQARKDEQQALFNLRTARRQFEIHKKMSAHYRMRHYHLSDHGYSRAAQWIDIKNLAWTPVRMLGETVVGVVLVAATAVLTVATLVGVVAIGAVAVVAKGVSLVKGLFSWIGSWFHRDPIAA